MNRLRDIITIFLWLCSASYSAEQSISIASGKVKLTVDPNRGGAPAGVWFDRNEDGIFSNDELMLDTGPRQGLILKVIEIPWKISGAKLEEGMILSDEWISGRLPQPRESWYSGESFQLTAVSDSIWQAGENRLVVLGRLIWAGNWKYRLDWELTDGGAIKGNFQLLDQPREIRPSEILALGMDMRFHYQNQASFLHRTVHAGVDQQIWEMPAGFFRWWYRIEALYLQRRESYGFKRLDEIPWPDYNIVCLTQSSHADCKLWKAIDWNVGAIADWYGKKSRGWLHLEDREWGIGFGLAKMADQPPASLSADMDTGDLTAAVQFRFVPEQTARQNPNAAQAESIFQPHAFFLVPNTGRWSEHQAELLDELGNPATPITAAEPDPNAINFIPPKNLPAATSNDEIARFRIDEPAGIDRESWPFTGGIPLRQGAIFSANDLILLDAAGKSLPIQAEALAYWPDRSIKWLLLDAQVDLPKNTGALFTLRQGKKIAAKSDVVIASATENGLRVNTGALAFEIDLHGSGFIDRAWLDINSNGKYETDELIVGENQLRRSFLDFIRSDAFRTGDHDIQGTLDESRVRITDLSVERAGPLRAVIKIQGHYLNRMPSPFTLRLEAFAGKTTIRAQHTFTYTMNPNGEFVHALGLQLPVQFKDGACVTLGGNGIIFKIDETATIGGLLQENLNNAMLWQAASDTGAVKILDELYRPAAWGDISNDRWGVTVAVQNFWQEYAKAIQADQANGTISAFFWPPQAQPLDLRRYSKWMYTQGGETNVPFAGGHVFEWRNAAYATGTAKTSTAVFDFHVGALQQERAENLAKGFQQRPLAICNPAYYAKIGIAGQFAAYDAKSFPQLEKSLTDIGDFFRYNRERFSWYGMLDYGDIGHLWRPPLRYDAGQPFQFRDGWGHDIGRWGWTNSEGLDALSFFMTFFHTGYRPYFEAGEITAVHNRDVDVFHYGPYRYKGRRHNVNHWGDGTIQVRISQPSHTRFQYYLTGDLRTKDIIDAVFQHQLKNCLIVATPELGAVLSGYLVQWEMTGDLTWRDQALALVRAYANYVGPDGGIQDSGIKIDAATHQLLIAPNANLADYSSCFFHDFGAMHALAELYYLTRDAQLWDLLYRHASYCATKGPANDLTGHRSYNWLLLSLALDKTGEKQFADRLLSNLSESEFNRGIYARDRKYWRGEWGQKIPDGKIYQMGDGRGTVPGVHDVYTVHTGFSWSQMPYVLHVMKKYGLKENQIPQKAFPVQENSNRKIEP
ncbi:MAG: hypothetical protein ACOY90_18285 [Candidatus Zhuqueibacterota bacterium]